MKFFNYRFLLLAIMVLSIVGCGGGGGGGGTTQPTTKTATLKFSAQSTTPNDSMASFQLSVKLPPGSFLPTDSLGGPLPGVVVFAGSSLLADDFFDKSSLVLNSLYVVTEMNVSQFINLGQFITIFVTVPVGYTPNVNDIMYAFTAKRPSGDNLTTVTVIPTFN